MTSKESKQIATTIIMQLGGKRFIAMTGAKKITHDGPKMWFWIMRNGKGVNYVQIQVNE